MLVNLGARTTHALYLDGAVEDRRHEKIVERGIPVLGLADLDRAGNVADARVEAPPLSAAVLGRGHVIDLPVETARYAVSASWQPHADPAAGVEVDVVAFSLTAEGTVPSDDEFVFYNQPSTPDGGVRLTVDGSCEQGIDLDLDSLGDDIVRVRIAAAIDGEATFGVVGAIRLSLVDSDDGREVASATLDAATDERTLVLAEVYRRHDIWRFRAVGQGYEHDLARLATDHGVQVD